MKGCFSFKKFTTTMNITVAFVFWWNVKMQGKVMMVNQVSAQGQTCFGHQKVQIRQKLVWKLKQKLYTISQVLL
jgi:uncharacterized membrane protein